MQLGLEASGAVSGGSEPGGLQYAASGSGDRGQVCHADREGKADGESEV